jgi:hypothetical protein
MSSGGSGRWGTELYGIVFIGVAQEKAQAFNGKKVSGQFQFDRNKTVYVNHYSRHLIGPTSAQKCRGLSFGHTSTLPRFGLLRGEV